MKGKKKKSQQSTRTAQAVIMGQSFPLCCSPAPFGAISAEGAAPGTKLRAGAESTKDRETHFCLLVIVSSKTLLNSISYSR